MHHCASLELYPTSAWPESSKWPQTHSAGSLSFLEEQASVDCLPSSWLNVFWSSLVPLFTQNCYIKDFLTNANNKSRSFLKSLSKFCDIIFAHSDRCWYSWALSPEDLNGFVSWLLEFSPRCLHKGVFSTALLSCWALQKKFFTGSIFHSASVEIHASLVKLSTVNGKVMGY